MTPAGHETVTELMSVAALVRAGATPDVAWERVGAAGPGVAASAALALSRSAGAPVADVLERVASARREAGRVRIDREAALAGPRASVRMLRWLPLAGLALAVGLEPTAVGALFTTRAGWVLAGAAGLLTWAGLRWLARLVGAAERAGADVEPRVVTIALLEAAVAGGKDLAGACRAVAQARGPDGMWLTRVADGLSVGQPWDATWRAAIPRAAAAADLERGLRGPWLAGASPVPALRIAAALVIDEGHAASASAAGELAVKTSLPLTLCLLPAFVLAGVVPLVFAVAASSGIAT